MINHVLNISQKAEGLFVRWGTWKPLISNNACMMTFWGADLEPTVQYALLYGDDDKTTNMYFATLGTRHSLSKSSMLPSIVCS